MDRSLLARVLGHTNRLDLRPAHISGWRCMMWGEYSALIESSPDDVVTGMVIEYVPSESGRDWWKMRLLRIGFRVVGFGLRMGRGRVGRCLFGMGTWMFYERGILI